ncbi:hypothetical protein GCM10010402_41240 [Actinomadura luteofluorescens]|uniref:dTMP kinase n=2 Tax=Actinomadura luteofluorescens TaxID=46163 RepID=UPI002164016F|nr:hypothetical protein [Actinomadura glauciflava]MCR3742637.1 thymidylate kinase [Actinomadura glauciflava]
MVAPGDRGRFMVLTGIDGSGKSSLLSLIAIASLTTAGWRDLRHHELPAVMAPDEPTLIKNSMSSLPRAMFIGGHIVAQYEHLVRPQLELGVDVLLDSYWYKVMAKEHILGTSHPILADLCGALPVPDAVILLEVDPRVAYLRKRDSLTSYECMGTTDMKGFIRFQGRLRDRLEEELAGHPALYRVDADRDLRSVLRSATDVVQQCAPTSARMPEQLV